MNIPMDNIMNINSQSEILQFIRKERVATTSEIATRFKISWNTAEKCLLELTIEQKIARIKKLGVNLWMLK